MKKIKLIPTLLISLAFISATTAGVIKLAQSFNPDNPNADHRNPIITLDANGGYFTIGTTTPSVISKMVRYATPWSEYRLNMPTPVKPGFDIKGWQYSVTGAGDWKSVPDSYVFTESVYLRVTEWGGSSPSSFATDSWATIVSEAKKGLTSLKQTYKNDIANFGNTFVIRDMNNQSEVNAKTRSVKLKGLGEYKVRVIGEDHDKIAGTDNQVAALTFEFVETPFPAHGFSSVSNVWETSSLKRFLDEEFIYRMPEPINDPAVLQVVEKTTYNATTQTLSTSDDRLFVPSLNEIGYRIFSENGEVNTMSKAEGSTYAFYNDNSNLLDSYLKYYTDESGYSQAVPYWTRSAFMSSYSTDKVLAHAIGSDSSVPDCNSDLTPIDTGNAVTPCFCIGTDTAYKLDVKYTVGSETWVTARWSERIVNGTDSFVSVFDNCDFSAPLFHKSNSYDGDIQEITVKHNGTTIHARDDYFNYNFDYTSGLLTLNIPKDSVEITGTVTVTIDGANLYSSPFASDSWETFVGYANQGYDALKTHYADDYAKNGNTFVGLKRRIKAYNGATYNPDYTVRVIGEKHDITTNVSDSKDYYVPLTFEFVNGIINSDIIDSEIIYQPYPEYQIKIPVDTYSGFASPFSNSYLLSNTYFINEALIGGFIPITSQEIDSSFPEIKDAARTVKKNSITYSNYGGYSMESFSDKMFLLSYEEYTGSTSALPEVEGASKSDEGDQYAYYENGGTLRKVAPYTHPFYWTRSLSAESYEKALGVSFQSGSVSSYLSTSTETGGAIGGIIPAFGIGIDLSNPVPVL